MGKSLVSCFFETQCIYMSSVSSTAVVYIDIRQASRQRDACLQCCSVHDALIICTMLSDVTAAAAAAADRQTRRSSFHAYNLPFLQIIPTVAFLFFFRTDSMDSPDCLPTLLSISVFYFLVFFMFFHFLVVGSVRYTLS